LWPGGDPERAGREVAQGARRISAPAVVRRGAGLPDHALRALCGGDRATRVSARCQSMSCFTAARLWMRSVFRSSERVASRSTPFRAHDCEEFVSIVARIRGRVLRQPMSRLLLRLRGSDRSSVRQISHWPAGTACGEAKGGCRLSVTARNGVFVPSSPPCDSEVPKENGTDRTYGTYVTDTPSGAAFCL